MFFSSFQTKLLQPGHVDIWFELSVRTMGCATSKGEGDSSLDGRADIGAVVPAAAKQGAALPKAVISQVPHTSVQSGP